MKLSYQTYITFILLAVCRCIVSSSPVGINADMEMRLKFEEFRKDSKGNTIAVLECVVIAQSDQALRRNRFYVHPYSPVQGGISVTRASYPALPVISSVADRLDILPLGIGERFVFRVELPLDREYSAPTEAFPWGVIVMIQYMGEDMFFKRGNRRKKAYVVAQSNELTFRSEGKVWRFVEKVCNTPPAL